MDKNNLKKEATGFLKQHKMWADELDFEHESNLFAEDMEEGLSVGEKSTLKMIPGYIDPSANVEINKAVIAVDAGGTNFRRALVTFTNKGPIINKFKKYPMPGVDKEVEVDEFFEIIAGYLNPIADKSENIGFCFSYPAEIMPDREGKIISLTKEVKVKNATGVEIGKELKNKLSEGSSKSVAVLNDATATLLSGKAMAEDKNYDDFIGLILGTGMNTCYVEKNINIKKSEILRSKEGYTLINLESGGYGDIKRGTADIRLDEKTINPGEQLMEKMLSGAYMGQLVLETIKLAASEGMLSEDLSDEICAMERLSSADSADFLDDPEGRKNLLGRAIRKHGTKEDGWLIEAIVDGLYERSAKYLAVNINGILIKTGRGMDPEKPICLVIDGSAFYGSKKFMEKFDRYLDFMKESFGRHVERIKVEDASLMGSAIAGLLR